MPPKFFGIVVQAAQEKPVSDLRQELLEQQLPVASVMYCRVHESQERHPVPAKLAGAPMRVYEYSSGNTFSVIRHDILGSPAGVGPYIKRNDAFKFTEHLT